MDLTNPNGIGEMGDQPPAQTFTHNLTAPGVPLETLISTIVLLLSAYGVTHDGPMQPNFDSTSINTGNDQIDARFQNDYMMFKMFLDGLSLDYRNVHCTMKASNVSVYMIFTCS